MCVQCLMDAPSLFKSKGDKEYLSNQCFLALVSGSVTALPHSSKAERRIAV